MENDVRVWELRREAWLARGRIKNRRMSLEIFKEDKFEVETISSCENEIAKDEMLLELYQKELEAMANI